MGDSIYRAKDSPSIRIAVFGQRGVGKTTFLSRYCGLPVPRPPHPTYGIDLFESVKEEETVEYVEFGGDIQSAPTYEVFISIFSEKRKDRLGELPFTAVYFFFDARSKPSLLQSSAWLTWLSAALRRPNLVERGARAPLRTSAVDPLKVPLLFIATKTDLLVEECQLRVGEYLARGPHPAARETFSGVANYLAESFNTPEASNVIFVSANGAEADFDVFYRAERWWRSGSHSGAPPFDVESVSLSRFRPASARPTTFRSWARTLFGEG